MGISMQRAIKDAHGIVQSSRPVLAQDNEVVGVVDDAGIESLLRPFFLKVLERLCSLRRPLRWFRGKR